MPMRLHITKGTAQGETIVVDIPQWNPVTGEVCHTVDDMVKMADEGLKIADMRLLDMHTKMLEAESLEQYCTPQEWTRIVSILDIISGRQTADLVKRRWHSEQEETADLEAARATVQRVKMCVECLADEPLENMIAPDPEYPNTYVCKWCYNKTPREESNAYIESVEKRNLYT